MCFFEELVGFCDIIASQRRRILASKLVFNPHEPDGEKTLSSKIAWCSEYAVYKLVGVENMLNCTAQV